MARRQAKKRKAPTKKPAIKLPTIRLSRILTPLFAVAVIALAYDVTLRLLDRPISALEVSGPMQRVSVVEIEDALDPELEKGFFGSDLSSMQEAVQRLQWIDQVSVARRWPDRIAISVTEQTPAAIWGKSGLMNVRGELFVEDGAQHLPSGLPRLSGPEDRAADVARRYLHVRERLLESGLDVTEVSLDKRGAWAMTLSNGIEVRLGRRDVDERTRLLVDIVADIITSRAADIDFVDMRYRSGFTIGWRSQEPNPQTDPDADQQEMLALRGTG